MGFDFILGDGWKGSAIFMGLGALFIALIVLAFIYFNKDDTVIGVTMIVAAIATAASFIYIHVKKVEDDVGEWDDDANLIINDEPTFDDELAWDDNAALPITDDSDIFVETAPASIQQPQSVEYSNRVFDKVIRDIEQAEAAALENIRVIS